MDLESAFESVQEIRHQLSRSVIFTGYRPVFLASVAALAAVLAVAQGLLGVAPTLEAASTQWMALASIIVILTVVFVFVPSLRSRFSVIRSVARGVARQFAPFVVVAVVGTAIAYQVAPQLTPYLPAGWCAAFGLSIFAMQPYLPRLVSMSGGWYLLVSIGLGIWPPHSVAMLALGMGLAFAIGHLATAAIMRVALPRKER
jgi:hypothetical protein